MEGATKQTIRSEVFTSMTERLYYYPKADAYKVKLDEFWMKMPNPNERVEE